MGKSKSKEPIVLRTKLIEEFASKIKGAWNKTLDGIFGLGDLLIQAREKLTKDEHDELLKRLPFIDRTAERLEKIANDKKLRRPAIQKLLPPCLGTLHEFSQYKPLEFKKAIKEGIVSQDVTARAVANFRSKLRGKSTKPSGSQSKIVPTPLETATGATLIFEIPEDLSTAGAIIDLRFLQKLCLASFHPSKNGNQIKIDVSTLLLSLFKKNQPQSQIYSELIEQVRNLENHKRKKRGKRALNDFQATLSLLGIDPDQSYSKDFCLLEALAISYALRQGVFTVEELKTHRKEIRAEIGILTEDLVKDATANVKKLTSKAKSKSEKQDSTTLESAEV